MQYGLVLGRDVKPDQRTTTCELLTRMFSEKKLLSQEDFEMGMQASVQDLEEVGIDFPNAGPFMGQQMAYYVAKGCATAKFLCKGFSQLKNCGQAEKVLGSFLKTLLLDEVSLHLSLLALFCFLCLLAVS